MMTPPALSCEWAVEIGEPKVKEVEMHDPTMGQVRSPVPYSIIFVLLSRVSLSFPYLLLLLLLF